MSATLVHELEAIAAQRYRSGQLTLTAYESALEDIAIVQARH